MSAAIATGQAFGFPIADDDQAEPDGSLIGGVTLGDLYLFVILIAGLRLHPGDPGRDRRA